MRVSGRPLEGFVPSRSSGRPTLNRRLWAQAKALTDTEELDGMQAARRKGAHSTEQQTSDYIRH